MKTFRALFLCLLVSLVAVQPALCTDLTITAANVVPSSLAQQVSGMAGATITAGQLVYQDPTDSTFKLADANGATPLYKVLGIALNNASSGQPLIVCKSDPALAIGGTVAAGAVLIASTNAGAIAPVADAASGSYISFVAVGIGSNKVNFNVVRSDVAKP